MATVDVNSRDMFHYLQVIPQEYEGGLTLGHPIQELVYGRLILNTEKKLYLRPSAVVEVEATEYDYVVDVCYSLLGQTIAPLRLRTHLGDIFKQFGKNELLIIPKNRVIGDVVRLDKDSDARRNILEHYRGYEFASKVDMNKIHDWKKVFSIL